jgi:hypothetical protein
MGGKAFFVALAIGLAAGLASASTIQNYEIVTGSSLSPVGGTYQTGGTYSGTFSVDISQLPGASGDAALPNVDITTTSAPDVVGTFPGVTYTSGFIVGNGTATVFGLTLESYLLEFSAQQGSIPDESLLSLTLAFIETPGTFVGGQIVAASEVCDPCDLGLPQSRSDLSGDAIAVDPSVVSTPEPSSAITCAIGLLAVCFGGAVQSHGCRYRETDRA